jgi:hypothetical protein
MEIWDDSDILEEMNSLLATETTTSIIDDGTQNKHPADYSDSLTNFETHEGCDRTE